MKNLTQNTLKQASHKDNFDNQSFDLRQAHPQSLTPESETAKTFTSFFPYLFNFIYANSTDSKGKPNWLTEKRYPITARRLFDYWQDLNTLIGVRFGINTAYGMLDIDKNSPYHPQRNEGQFRGILQALEDIGLVRPLIVQSSFSEGLHIYYPLPNQVSSFALACGIKACLNSHGYEIASGVLEIFPNTKAFGSEFNGHRLPLQKGSYMLNDDLEKIGNDLNHFVFVWQMCQDSQDIDLLKESIAEAKENYQPPKLSRKTDEILKWRDDLEKQIADGWTGKGQSNRLLYTIGKYARVFLGCADVAAIAKYITKTARATAGFFKFCGDIHRLEKKAKSIAEWCLKHHFPWGSKKTEQTNEVDMSKAERQAERIERIRLAVSELKNTGAMPQTIRGMAQAIAKTAKVSVETLYDNKELWHPEFTQSSCNASQPKDVSQETPLTDIAIESAENSLQSTVTDNPLYEALGFFETPLRGQDLPKFAKSDVTDFADTQTVADGDRRLHQITPPELVNPPQKSNGSMWIETHGRLAPPKTETATGAIAQNPTIGIANAACLQVYQPPQNQAVSEIESRIGYLKAILETPILRRGKSAPEIARLQSELERLECDRKNLIATDEHLQNC
ncbi:hypothetical protein [Pseudanabaena mucicola]|uniref:Uncharacterized protein n=1 Tax=Pseudanabaena mucicola FACHB-723 TaxID=2692860 RepID=A0ABR8A1Q8_9CYAN|nr:hypothetical protein [Pseudanabaena mucicola]MBD2189989.1 hypothetical protein [Pseudanabaena mucicola FACHB-723]